MKIALDYDNTYNANPIFWSAFIDLCIESDIDVRIVTARSPTLDRLSKEQFSWLNIPVIYCDSIAKRFYCHWFADDGKGWDPDIWIDDKPEGIINNSTATKEVLEKWRTSEEYMK